MENGDGKSKVLNKNVALAAAAILSAGSVGAANLNEESSNDYNPSGCEIHAIAELDKAELGLSEEFIFACMVHRS